jgi:hypothetical protein
LRAAKRSGRNDASGRDCGHDRVRRSPHRCIGEVRCSSVRVGADRPQLSALTNFECGVYIPQHAHLNGCQRRRGILRGRCGRRCHRRGMVLGTGGAEDNEGHYAREPTLIHRLVPSADDESSAHDFTHKHNRYQPLCWQSASDSLDSPGSVWIANHSGRVLTTAKLPDKARANIRGGRLFLALATGGVVVAGYRSR